MDSILSCAEDCNDQVEAELSKLFRNLPHYTAGVEFQNMHRKWALLKLKNKEIEAVYHLAESHSPELRRKAAHRFERCSGGAKPVTVNKKHIAYRCSSKGIQVEDMLRKLKEMPKEWTLIQLTPQFDVKDSLNVDVNELSTPALHVSVFDCGNEQVAPFCVSVDRPRDKSGSVMNLWRELDSIRKENKNGLLQLQSQTGNMFKSHADKLSYIESRLDLNYRMKNVVKQMQDAWLREWKCLFIGKFVDATAENEIDVKLNDLLAQHNLSSSSSTSHRSKYLLMSLTKGIPHLTIKEIRRAIQQIFPNVEEENHLVEITKFVRALSNSYNTAKAKRHPVILIIDDKLDIFPWEMMNVLVEHPASRMPSLHFTYALFKEHEPSIEGGMKVGVDSEKGTYILNPNLDLKKMEVRLFNFFKYWKPNWDGLVGVTPSSQDFENILTSGDIFSYNGHGNGTQFFSGDRIQRMRVNAVVLLFGCSSIRLSVLGPQVEMTGSYQMYLIACSPCILGMLWEVTDIDTDILTTEFLSQWLPSKAPNHWKQIDKKKWEADGEITALSRKPSLSSDDQHEPEILRALCKAKKQAKNFLTQAACVVRGLPVKIQ